MSTDALRIDGYVDGQIAATMSLASKVTTSSDTVITFGNGFNNSSSQPDGWWDGKPCKIVFTRGGQDYALGVSFLNVE